jgi:hypothetical protein
MGCYAPAMQAATVVPEDGYWHSSAVSDHVLRCPNPGACRTACTRHSLANGTCISRTDFLRSVQLGLAPSFAQFVADRLVNASVVLVQYAGPHFTYAELQCAEGYRGPLCGVCKPGYGALPGYRCVRCRARAEQAVLYILSLCLSLVMIAITMHGSLNAVKHFRALQQVGGSAAPYEHAYIHRLDAPAYSL